MNITTNVASDEPDNQSTEQVPGPSAQSKSWYRSEIYFSSFVAKFDNSFCMETFKTLLELEFVTTEITNLNSLVVKFTKIDWNIHPWEYF